MAAQKKPTGLGRGLDELLDDNTLSKRTEKPLVVAKGEVSTPNSRVGANINSTIYDVKPKELYETRPKTRSLKSNFKK